MGILESTVAVVLLLTLIVLCVWLMVFLTYWTVDIISDIKTLIAYKRAYKRMLQKEQNEKQ